MLAQERPFDLSALNVRPASLQLVGPGGSWQVEHKVMQLLVVLAKAGGGAVGRDEIIDICWQGRVISEDALNRCVSRLRKALQPDPRLVVEAVPKVGYRLRVLETAPVRPAAEAGLPQGALRWLAAGVLLAICVAGGLAWMLRPPQAVTAVKSLQILTGEPLPTLRPALSPDGGTVVYSAGAETIDLYMRSTRDGAPVRLTDTPEMDEYSPAWSPKGDRLAYVVSHSSMDRPDAELRCRVMVMSVPGGRPREVGRCVTDAGTGLSWLDEKTLLYADREAPRTPRRIRAMDVDTGQTRDLSQPSEGLADQDPFVSPDGRRVLFRRIKSVGVDEMMIQEVDSGREWPLLSDGNAIHGMTWTRDGRQVVFSSNRGGDKGLWVIDVKSRAEPRRLSVGLMAFGRMSADDNDHIAVEIHNQRARIEAARAAGSEPVDPAEGMDADPDVARDGATAFVSSRSGTPELWMAPSGGRAVRLTRREGGSLYQPRWSPDGARIVFIAVERGASDLYEIGRDGSGLRRLTNNGTPKHSPAWGGDWTIRYVTTTPEGSRVMRVEANGSVRPEPGAGEWQVLRTAPDGRLYGWGRGDRRLWVMTPGGGKREAIPGFRMQDPYWVVGRNGVYFLSNAGRRAGLRFKPWVGEEQELRRLSNVSWTSDVSVDPRDDSFVYANNGEEVRDIAVVSLAR
ncbi:winged helix-turn-helix domain-containing protein [Caulobacter segnis]|uniref:winged helix-turn-helix domain-containing protein n=1 Tax=Caulobacter segnis TaxID=88688 RepID=UPI00240FEFF4|nr:winged helix-turn-helix domain-containing protein [Caulobacter segnis]MDG2522514.1 winged helix-turn-helix domain-containing protein [Caulobacter segnis]